MYLEVRPSTWKVYLRKGKFTCGAGNFFVSNLVTPIDPLSAPSAAQSPTLSLRQPGKMSSPLLRIHLQRCSISSQNFYLPLTSVKRFDSMRLSILMILVRATGHMAPTTTIPARPLLRAVCSVVTVVVVVSGAVLIDSTAGRAFCYPVGTRIFFGLV